MNKTFKCSFCAAWTVTDSGISYKNQFYSFSEMTSIKESPVPKDSLSNGVVQIYITGKVMPLTLAYSYNDRSDAQEAIKYIKEHYGSAEIQKQNQTNKEKENIGLVYDLQGVRGRYMKVYENRAVIGVKATIGSLFSGNLSDGEKTIYYRDCIGVQFKESGLQIGYLQLETASGIMNNKQSNFFNENSFTFDTTVQTNEKMIEVANYVRSKVEEAKSGEGQTIIKEVSAADEIKKFKELLDMGVITQEEFDAKKKQLLGL